MAQAAPSNLAYSQAIELIAKLRKEYAENKLQDSNDISQMIKDILTKFDSGVGFALTEFEPVAKGEPPRSDKMNRFWSNLQSDVNILQDQMDVLRASTVFAHNFAKTEVLKSQQANMRLRNKLKTLQIYSQTSDASLIKLGDSFVSDEFIDWQLVSASERAAILSSGYVSLASEQTKNNVLANAKIKVTGSSNGFLGNNQEIQDPLVATSNAITSEKEFRFIAEDYRAADLQTVLDSEPNTWIEYEYYKVNDSDRQIAKNFNFYYKVSNQDETIVGVSLSSSGLVDWAKGPDGDTLRLELEIDLNIAQSISTITLSPYGLIDNKNNPIKVVSVYVSEDGTSWEQVTPGNLWIVNTIDKNLSIIDLEQASVGSATWVTNGSITRYIRFKIEQPNPVAANIGHLYYVSDKTGANNSSNISVAEQLTTVVGTNAPVPIVAEEAARVEGPVPDQNNPDFYYQARNTAVNGLIQKREFFFGKRWAIGIRDIEVKSSSYKSKSALISKKFSVPGIIDRVALEADITIPSGFDQSTAWVRFFISPNEGVNWYQISRIQDDFLGIPEIIAFNDPTPAALREPGISYVDIPEVKVSSVRVKIELERPSDKPDTTPIVKSYNLKIKRR
jgi:hypothetical protein